MTYIYIYIFIYQGLKLYYTYQSFQQASTKNKKTKTTQSAYFLVAIPG